MNPSFRVYQVDKQTYKLLDYEQYRLMIPQANKDKQANWVVSFSFKKYYEVNSLETSEFERILIRMKVLILFNLA